jgi:hypothetical protein
MLEQPTSSFPTSASQSPVPVTQEDTVRTTRGELSPVVRLTQSQSVTKSRKSGGSANAIADTEINPGNDWGIRPIYTADCEQHISVCLSAVQSVYPSVCFFLISLIYIFVWLSVPLFIRLFVS